MISAYSLIIYKVYEQHRKFHMENKQSTIATKINMKVILILVSIYIVSFIPYTVTLIYLSFKRPGLNIILGLLVTQWLYYLNSCCNPIVYGFFHQDFRTAIKALCCKKKEREERRAIFLRMLGH